MKRTVTVRIALRGVLAAAALVVAVFALVSAQSSTPVGATSKAVTDVKSTPAADTLNGLEAARANQQVASRSYQKRHLCPSNVDCLSAAPTLPLIPNKLSVQHTYTPPAQPSPSPTHTQEQQQAPPTNTPPVSASCSSYSGNRALGCTMMLNRGFGIGQMQCLGPLWDRESGWDVHADNPSSGAYGIPQALPGDKMAANGSDWQNNAATQISWGLDYIASRYGTPCGAWDHSQAYGWY